MNGNRSAFSLLELMIVICIGMIVITLGMANTRMLNKAVVISQIDLLYTTCLYLQRTAMARNEMQELSFDDHAHSYSYNGSCCKLPASLHFGILPNAKGPPSSPHATLSSAITFAGKKISFHPSGIIDSGTLYLIDDHNQDLYAISSGVAHVSMLRKHRYDGKWHLL